MRTDLVAFIDESKRPVRDPATGRVAGTGDHYVVAAAIVLSGDLDGVRGALVAATETLGSVRTPARTSPQTRRGPGTTSRSQSGAYFR